MIKGHGFCFLGFFCRLFTEMSSSEEYVITTETSGNLTSPGYPASPSYHSNVHLVWHILAPVSSRILFLFHFLDLEYHQDCLYDYVLIHDNSTRQEFRYCGTRRELHSYATHSNQATVIFNSDFEGGPQRIFNRVGSVKCF